MTRVLALARREAAAYVASPLALVIAALFLVVQGFSFYAVLRVLADPRSPAPYGAVLRTHFGGTFLYWSFLLFVAAALSMRLVADERHKGTWEALRTAPVGGATIVCGKWLGALAYYALLWAPTLVYVAVLRALAPPGAGPDAGPIATAYFGVLVCGASFLAVGLCASALADSQVAAAVLAFVALVVWLLLGLVPELSPSAMARHPAWAAVLRAIDVRRHMDDFARGIVDLRHVLVHAGVAFAALVAAAAVVGAERHPRRLAASAALGAALAALAALLANVLAARHPVRLDATRAQVYTLDAKTRRVLGELRRPVKALVVRAGEPQLRPLYDEVDELLAAFRAAAPLLTVDEIDPAVAPGRLAELAEDYSLAPDELSGGGAVLFVSGDRRRGVALLDMADVREARVVSFRGEEELAAALLDVSEDERPEICFTAGHGEPTLDDDAGLAPVARALAGDAYRVSEMPPGPVPARCAAVVVAAPKRPFGAGDAAALDDLLERGGRLMVLVDDFAPTGLERLLERRGVRLAAAVAVDPAFETGAPLTWATFLGYGDHPIAAAFSGRRATVWIKPRAVEPVAGADGAAWPLVRTSPAGWGERDVTLARAPEKPGADAIPGPVSIAVAAEDARTGARVVAFGSARSFIGAGAGEQGGADVALLASSSAWLTGRTKLLGVGPKTPEQLRLVLGAAQEERVFWLCVLGLPLGVALLGAGRLALRRRGT
ncbi:MAG TPA: Gldg family protein [Haliangiales bacterium]|nr:Gldg family protein [Haliangiales bacterium]